MTSDSPQKKISTPRFDFNAAVNEVLRDHPALGGKIVFIDTLDNDKKYGTPEAILASEFRGPARRLGEHLKFVHAKEVSLSFNKDVYGIGALLFHAGNQHRIFSPDNADHAGFASFDHELGHLLTKGGFDFTLSQPLAECAADAYAALRHIQRFGSDTPTLEHASFMRAYNFIMKEDAFYLTSFTLDQIRSDAKATDFSGLSPLETVARADEYARQCAAKGPQIADLLDLFAPVRQSFVEHGATSAKPLITLARVLADIKIDHPAKVQAQVLGKKVIDHFIDNGTLTGPEWDKTRKDQGKTPPPTPPSPRL